MYIFPFVVIFMIYVVFRLIGLGSQRISQFIQDTEGLVNAMPEYYLNMSNSIVYLVDRETKEKTQLHTNWGTNRVTGSCQFKGQVIIFTIFDTTFMGIQEGSNTFAIFRNDVRELREFGDIIDFADTEFEELSKLNIQP